MSEDERRGIRNNNPGNIDFNRWAFGRDPWVGEVGLETHDTPRFTTFLRPEYGVRALCKLLLTYYRHRKAADGSKIDTVREFIQRWAPASENDTEAYAMMVRRAIGVRAGQEINLEDLDTLVNMALAIIHHENGKQPYLLSMVYRGAEMALGLASTDLEILTTV